MILLTTKQRIEERLGNAWLRTWQVARIVESSTANTHGRLMQLHKAGKVDRRETTREGLGKTYKAYEWRLANPQETQTQEAVSTKKKQA